jgi:hypothetical protein
MVYSPRSYPSLQFMRFGGLLAGPCVEGATLLRYEYFSLIAPGTRRAPIELAN